jgi:phenylalanyl-tRNA synthetase beta chain
VILDADGRVLSMPPIINGELTKLTENTSEIFVEMTGTEKRVVDRAMNILASVFAEKGWKLYRVKIQYPDKTLKTPDYRPVTRVVSMEYINGLLGLNLSPREAVICLEKTGYSARANKGSLSVDVPAYRADILHDIDLVEDVAVGYGYEHFDPEIPLLSTTGSRLAMDYTMGKAKMSVEEKAVKVKNPISEEHTIVRTHLLPGILGAFYLNRHREMPQRIFELGDALKLDSTLETGARIEKKLSAGVISSRANFSEAKSIFTSLLRDLDIGGSVEPVKHPSFIRGRCAGIDGVGYFGEIHPRVISNFNLEYPVAALEILL